MMWIKPISVVVLLLSAAVSSTYAAVQALATRIVYSGENAAATLSIRNNADQAYMLQTWLSDAQAQNSKNLPLIVVPPLLKIDAGKESVLRFMYSGQGLPTDKESLFWIHLQEIPPKPKQENVLQLAIHSRIKLFYRPKSIQITMDDAVKQLIWHQEGQQLKLTNPSQLHITIGVLKFSDSEQEFKTLDADMVAPGETITVLKQLPAHGKLLSYTYINDYGGSTQVLPVTIQ